MTNFLHFSPANRNSYVLRMAWNSVLMYKTRQKTSHHPTAALYCHCTLMHFQQFLYGVKIWLRSFILVKQRLNSPYTSSTLLLLHYYNLRKSRTDLKSEVWFFVWGVPLNFATDYLKIIQIRYKLGVSFDISYR